MQRILSVLFWSVISAAFIGPGTVTAAASAGAGYGYSLLWALLFSTVACFVLQEASARLTVVSGRNLGQALRARYPQGVRRLVILGLVLGAVVLGCAAYEAGNILGGVAGAVLALPVSRAILTVGTVALAALLLWFNSPRRVAVLLSILVAVMGSAFVWTALRLAPSWGDIARGALAPRLPEGSALLAVALVGTTVVPYNLFLGSGLARGQSLSETRFGLGVAIGLGGLISMGVLVVGTATEMPLEFSRLSSVLAGRLGDWARPLFAFGLLAAGLSSAITAPLAAAITAKGLFSEDGDRQWGYESWRFRSVWAFVLAVGLFFGLSGVRPVPAIVLAQALNGILLPFVAVFLALAVNDRGLMGKDTNRPVTNVLLGGVVCVAIFLGVTNVLRAGARALATPPPPPGLLAGVTIALAVLIAVVVFRSVAREVEGEVR